MTDIYVLPGENRFPLGQVSVTAAADTALLTADIADALARRGRGDWGDVCPEDRAANDRALAEGKRLHSVYHGRNGIAFWVITEWDRSATTVLLPDDY